MKHDFSIATAYSDVLRNNEFMDTMSKIGLSVATLIADDKERGQAYDTFAKEHGVQVQLEEYANGMSLCDAPVISGDNDPFAITQMMRLLMKETNLSAAFQSGAVKLNELSQLDIPAGVITGHSIDALARMGVSSLAAVAALNMK